MSERSQPSLECFCGNLPDLVHRKSVERFTPTTRRTWLVDILKSRLSIRFELRLKRSLEFRGCSPLMSCDSWRTRESCTGSDVFGGMLCSPYPAVGSRLMPIEEDAG